MIKELRAVTTQMPPQRKNLLKFLPGGSFLRERGRERNRLFGAEFLSFLTVS